MTDDEMTDPSPLGAYAARLMARRDARARRKGKPDPDAIAKRPAGDDFAWLDRVVARAIDEIADLTDFEADFASQLASRLGKYGPKTMVTEKQLAKARELAAKLGVDVPERGDRPVAPTP